MESSGHWTAVTLSSATPQLLIKTRFDRTGYHIQLTDLSRIWEESLSKQEIIKRAIDSGCSFNPGDDDGNYETFLKCIKSALNGEAKTTSNLRAGDAGRLFLDLSSQLSGGLPDLQWTIDFHQLPEAAVATEIVGPLLLQANSLQSQIQQLVDEISSKDHVIQKITDKLEATACDLTAVFPGLSNVKTSLKRTQSQRSHFAGHVKGLADFDEVGWKASHVNVSGGHELTPDMINTVLRDLPPSGYDASPSDNWVQNLASTRSKSQGRSQVPTRTRDHDEGPTIARQDTQDEGFQRQDTPPHLSKQSVTMNEETIRARSSQPAEPTQSAQIDDDSETETEDEDCLDIPPTASQQQAVNTIEPAGHSEEDHNRSSTRPKSQSEDLGRLQSPQSDIDQRNEGPASSPHVIKSKTPSETHETESEAEPEAEEKKTRKGGLGKFGGSKPKIDPPPTDREEKIEPPPAKPKGSLGKFGGKKAQPPTSTPEPDTAPTKPKSSLGRFGGKAKNNTSTEPSLTHEEQGHGGDKSVDGGNAEPKTAFSRRLESDVQPAPERELTEEEKQQRADEKREKLKRELEEKAKGPVKKKRKF